MLSDLTLGVAMGCLLTSLPLQWYPPAPSFPALRGVLAMIGQTIGHYRVVECLGAGGMGVVYRAEDSALHRSIALKFLHAEFAADHEGRARFLREARMAAALNHPNTCTVYQVGEVDSTPFIAMELIEGETLAARLARTGWLPVAEALDIAIQVAEGLAEAHSQHIVHRDLKPQNVMVRRGGRVKILDFGLAKPLEKSRPVGATISTSDLISADLGHVAIFGTCGYMSPEQALGKTVDQRSDVFAFGIMLYELVTGERPFQADTVTAVLAKIIEAEPEPISSYADVPAELTRLVRRCLQKKPTDRYQDTHELVSDLKEVRRATGQTARMSDRTRARGKGMQAAMALLLVVPLIYLFMHRSVGNPEQPLLESRDIVLIAPYPPPPANDFPKTRGNNRSINGSRERKDETGEDGTNPAPRAGTLVISSNPVAMVAIDGKVVGPTPVTIETAPGTRELTMTTPDGLRWRGRVDVAAAGQSVNVHRELNAVGTVAVVSDVWAEVSLDGGPPEQTPIQFPRVATGLHELRAFRDGYVPQRLEILVEESKTTGIRLTMEKKP